MPPKRANRFWKYLRNFRKRQNGENGVCGTSASIKMEKIALAELPQASKWEKSHLRDFRKRQNGENSPCRTSASVKMGKWPLRNFRKRQNGENGPCGTSASVKMGKMVLAELPQASKWRKWPLRNFRKHQNGGNGPCGTPANTKKFFEALAGVPQTLTLFWGSMARNGTTKTAGYRRVCAPLVPGRICWRTLLIPSVCHG